MKNLNKCLLVLMSLALMFSTSFTINANAAQSHESEVKTITFEPPRQVEEEAGPQTFLVKVKDKKNKSKIVKDLKKKSEKKFREFKYLDTIAVETDKDELLELQKKGEISFEKDAKIKILEVNEEQSTNNITQVNAPKVHNLGNTGQGVKVAVFDTGISQHQDLAIKGGISFIEGSNFDVDENGHGTHVAGVIGALKNNIGIIGIAPSVDLYSVKVLDKDGNGSYSSIIQGIEWAIENDIDVINMSLGGFQDSTILEEAINIAYENNIIVVASAGNTGDQITFPAKYENVISVGSVDQDNNRSLFSSIGTELDIVAPGENIYSTYKNDNYTSLNGTSMAAPHVTGVLSLIWSKDLTVDNDVIKGLLNYSALGLGDSYYYGNGLVDASNALTMYDEYVLKMEKTKKAKKKFIGENKQESKNAGNVDGVVTAGSISDSYYLESSHPYANNYSNTWNITKSGAIKIRVHFSRIEAEFNFDYIRTSAGDFFTGYHHDVWSGWSNSSSINVTLTTDGSVVSDGFYIDKIEYVMPDTSGGGNIEEYNLESSHPYTNNETKKWTINRPDATNIRVHFKSIDTETNYDYITTSSGNSWSGSYTGIWSNWSGSSSIDVTLTTDGSIVKDGFYIDKIEYIASNTVGGAQEEYNLESPHPYYANYEEKWTVSKNGASKIRVHFSYIDTEYNYDYVTTSAGDSWSGVHSDVWSNWSNTSSIDISLTSDGGYISDGFVIDKIEYMMEPGILAPDEVAADPYWPDAEDTTYPNNPRIGYLSGNINTSGQLTVYDGMVLNDPDLVQYMNTTSGELQYDDTDVIDRLPQVPYENTSTTPDAVGTSFGTNTLTYNNVQTSANSNQEVNADLAWLAVPLIPIVGRVVISGAAKLVVKQTLKNSTKQIVIRNGHLAGKTHPVTGVRFSTSGFPQFTSKFNYTLANRYIKSSNSTQFSQANAALKNAINNSSTVRSRFSSSQLTDIRAGRTPNGYVWHHNEKTGLLQLVDKIIHTNTGHTGGKAIWGSL